MTFANLLTASRLVVVPFMLLSAWWQRPLWFALLLGYALMSDAIDGTIARKMGTASALGARLDSIADAAVYLTAPIAALALYPVLRERELVTVLVVFLAYVVPIAIGYLKYRCLTAYHTLAARVSGILLGLGALAFVTIGITWPLRAAAAVLVFSAFEEIAITAVLAAWTPNVWTLIHAWRRRPAPGQAVAAKL